MRFNIASLRRPILSFIKKRNYSNKPVVGHYEDAHMNELPVPCIPWEPWYTQKQTLYTRILAFGVIWWLFSFGLALYTDSIYLNCRPPKQPGPPSDMIDTCIVPDD